MNNLSKLYSSSECDIFYNEDLRCIQSCWKGIFVEGHRLHEIFNLLIMFLDLKQTDMIIADAKNMLQITAADQQWTIDDWYPRAVMAGFRYQGLILSSNTFNELAVKSISANYNNHIIVTEYFDNVEDALEWGKRIKEDRKMVS